MYYMYFALLFEDEDKVPWNNKKHEIFFVD